MISAPGDNREIPNRHAWIAPAINAGLSFFILILLIPLYLEFVPVARQIELRPELRRAFTAVILVSALYLFLRGWGHTKKAIDLYRRSRFRSGATTPPHDERPGE